MKSREAVVTARILVEVTGEVNGTRRLVMTYVVGVNADGRFAICRGECEGAKA